MICDGGGQVGLSGVGGLASGVSSHSTETNDRWGIGGVQG